MTRSALSSLVMRALLSGAVGTGLSAAALALVGRTEGRGAAQALNATSHWLYGKRAAGVGRADRTHTLVGFATHATATVFWAAIFEASLSLRAPRTSFEIFGRAVATSALAATVDYTITPRRFTPGWELILSKRSMAAAYTAMALGFAAAAKDRH